jgi:putative DNA primase/helicase
MVTETQTNVKVGTKPVALAVKPDGIPAELRALNRWVVWKIEWNGKKWTKVPYRPDRRHASSTDPSTWSSFAEALAAYRAGNWDGIGLIHLHSDGLTGIDFDHCRDRETGTIDPWARAEAEALDTYTEASATGTGLRAYAYGKKPGRRCKKDHVEIYDGLTAEGKQGGRFLTVTGCRLDGYPAEVQERQQQIEALYRKTFGDGASCGNDKAKNNGEAHANAFTFKARGGDCPLPLNEAERARWNCLGTDKTDRINALFSGNTSAYATASEADLALCFFLLVLTNGDRARAEQLFNDSALGKRGKWKDRQGYRDRTFAEAAKDFTPWRDDPAAKVTGAGGDQIHLTDLGNARRVVARHGADLRYCHPWKTWLTWDGKRWAEDQTGEVVRRVKETQAALYRETAEAIRSLGDVGDDEDRKGRLASLARLLKHALAWEDARAVGRCLDLARSEPQIPVLPPNLDADTWLLNCTNGTVDLRTGHLRRHRREDLLMKLAGAAYDPDATCPLWERCLLRWMGNNAALVGYLQRVVGYCLTGDVREQALWFLYGTGANGKSTFLLTLLALLGDYGLQTAPELLTERRGEAHPTERADLFGRRLAATIETEEGKRLAEALMKQLTGGDRVRARRMRQDFWEFDPTHKLFLAANHKPVVRGTDLAVWRRIKLVPFTVTIPDKEKDKALPEKLRVEMPGILTWAVRGCRDWQARGLDEPEEVRQATAAYQAEQDTLATFLAQCCHLRPEMRVKASTLHDAYIEWSGDKVTRLREFGDRLRSMGYQDERKNNGYWWHGIGLIDAVA